MSLTRWMALAASALAAVVLFDAWRVARTVRDRPVKIDAPGLEPGDRFGASVAVDGDWLAVGAPGDDGTSADAGAVYTYRRAGLRWVSSGTLRASDAGATLEFGHVVARSAQRLAVASELVENGAPRGAVFVFTPPAQPSESWRCETVLTSPAEATDDDAFGCALALEGETLLVGASHDSESAELGGAVHVFERRGGVWTHAAKLLATQSDVTKFGAALALSGSTALVGAPGDDEHGRGAGSAHVFERDDDGAWHAVAKLATRDGELGGALGTAVALDRGVAAVSAPRDGAVFVFERTPDGAWTESARLVLASSASGLAVGDALALHGERVLVSAAGDSDHGDASGAALLFVSDGEPRVWRGLRKLTAPDASAGARFASSLAQGERCAVFGAPGNASETGAAYVIELLSHAGRGE